MKEWKTLSEPEKLEQIRTWRRTLHQNPETELNVPWTAAYCKEQIKDLDVQIEEYEECGSSFTVYFDLGKDKTIAFRTDMDALPVLEKTERPFKSRKEGFMHACGHDGHMSNLLALAHELDIIRDELEYNILLIFQAGEETPGGARLLCEKDILENHHVKAVFGMHLWPMLPAGVLATRPLELMAQSCEVKITVQGKSAHAARYKEGVDAMETAAHLLIDFYDLEKSIDPKEYRLLRFGSMHSGNACNVVADTCVLEGTCRAFLDPVFQFLVQGIEDLCKKWEEKSHARISVEFSSGYPAVLNDVELSGKILAHYPQLERLKDPEMISEDFSFYQKRVPGVFFFLGTGTGIALHNDHFDFDEEILLKSSAFFKELALNPFLE